jgi:transposase-like protein
MLPLSSQVALHQYTTLAPEYARCPRCGALSPRNEIRRRSFWIPDLERPRIWHFDTGCYLCPQCPEGSRWFRIMPAGFDGDGQYTARTRGMVVDLVRRYKMSLEGAAALTHDMLHLPVLHPSTILGWVRDAGDSVDFADWQAKALEAFSGQIALDEVYDGEWCQLKATDPVNGMELAWYLHEGSADKDVIVAFLEQLKAAGFMPSLVVTDGSSLYPDAIRQVWPEAEHQRCVFHFMQQVNEELGKAFWELYREVPRPPKRSRGRPKKRGRPRKDAQKRLDLRTVRNARFLVLTREGTSSTGKPLMSPEQQAALRDAIAILPRLGLMRRFVNALHDLFSVATTTTAQVEAKRHAILVDTEFAAASFLSEAMKLLADDDLFHRLTRYLDFDCAEKTSNHVERENREFRKRQKSHYRLRSLASLCSLLDLLTTRRPITGAPRRIARKKPPCVLEPGKEVKTAA